MKWNDHTKIIEKDAHAFLSGSKYAWVNYDEEKLFSSYVASKAAERGTKLHKLAADLIEQKVKLPRSSQTLNAFVNDAIGFKMLPEVTLYYSRYAFGTADAICYNDNKKILRIHDLKTGVTKPNFMQLDIYAALFFLEYYKIPGEVQMEFRIYYQDDILVRNPEADDILPIMDKIRKFSNLLAKIDSEMEV